MKLDKKLGINVHPRYGYCPKCNEVRELVPTNAFSPGGALMAIHYTCRCCTHIVEVRMAQ